MRMRSEEFMVFQRFYTYPPIECKHPWVLRRLDWKPLPCKHEIVDVGILDLLEPPHKHTEDKFKLWKTIKTDGWKVVFDCFDLKGEFDIDCGFDTVEYSKELLEQFYNGEPNLMPVIQGFSNNYNSFKEYTDYLNKEFNPKIIGVSGSVGRNKDRDFVYKVLKYIKRTFPDSWIHVFALHKNNFKKCHNLIDSFDSMNWTRPRTSGRGSCKNKAERIEFFWDYVATLNLPFNEKEQEVLTCF
jgi:hypothetical protein